MSSLDNLADPNAALVDMLANGNASSNDGDEDSSSTASGASSSSSNKPLSLVRRRRQEESRLDRLEGQIGRLTSLLEDKERKKALSVIRIPLAKQDGAGSGSARLSRRDRKKQREKRSRRSNRGKLASFLSHSDAPPRRGTQPARPSRFQRYLPSRVPSSSDDDDFKLPGPTSADVSTSLYDPLAGITLARILHGHRSVYQFVQSNPWKNQRGMHEARRIALVLDSLLEELGSEAESLTATEMLVRNLVGLRFADTSNSTSMLEIMELAPPSALLPKQLEQAAFKAAKRLDTFRSNTRSVRPTGDRNKTNNNFNKTKTKTKNHVPSGGKSGGEECHCC